MVTEPVASTIGWNPNSSGSCRAAAGPPAHFHRNPLGCASFGRLLCRSSVKDHSGYSQFDWSTFGMDITSTVHEFAGSFCLALAPGVIAATIYGSWCYFSSEYDKTKSAENQKLAQLH
jgi:hypothetical protein